MSFSENKYIHKAISEENISLCQGLTKMRLQAFFAFLIAQHCFAQDESNLQENVLKKISTLIEEVSILKNQDVDKEGRIQAIETKVLILEQAAEHKDKIIENLLSEVEILQNQINETNVEIGQQADQFENHEHEFQGRHIKKSN